MNVDEEFSCTPPEIRQIAETTVNNLLPNKSRPHYEKQYNKFEEWCNENKIIGISENVLLAYFELQRKKYKPSTLWTTYSMLRSCLSLYKDVDISKYNKLQALLKRSSEGYVPKKSKILEEDDVNKFIREADDKMYLAMKLTIFTYQEVTPGVNDCWATFTEPWGAKAYVTWYGISVFIVPLVVLIVTYTCICREIWRSSAGELGQRQRQAHLPKPLPGKRTPLISRAKINTVKQTIAVIVMYIVCSTPFICAQLWATWDPKSYENPFFDGPAFTILTLLYSLNSCVNPWIYLAFNRELPRLLLRHYTAASKNYRSTGTGNSTSNSSGGVESTSLRAASRWPLCNSGRSSKCATRPLQRHYAAQYNTRRWIVTTAT